nr:H-NS histone family protein [Candidatus Thiosymbion oneisti]
MSVDEIQQQLRELAQNRDDLERALVQRHQQAKLDLVQQIKDLIQDQGFETTEIISQFGPKGQRRKAGTKTGGSRQYKQYFDPDNPENIYVRGVIPGWMKQKMQDQGYDPNSKPDREAFKANSLRILEG